MKFKVYLSILVVSLSSCSSNKFYEEMHLKRAQKYLSNHKYKEAINDFNYALALNPKHYRINYHLAVCKLFIYDDSANLTDALNNINICINKSKKKYQYQYFPYRAMIYAKINQFDKAMNDLDSGIFFNDNLINKDNKFLATCYDQRSTLKLITKDTFGAKNDINKAIILDSTNFELYLTRANLKKKSGDKIGCCLDVKLAYSLSNKDDKISIKKRYLNCFK
jgi:tetratricopeptide (TPR) repeat protein